MGGAVACMLNERNSYRGSVGKPEGKEPPERLKVYTIA
jgi:hypothetical protein